MILPRAIPLLLAGALTGVGALPRAGHAAGDDPEARDFFEKKIRPVLSAECYACHAGKKDKGGLLLDSREHLLEGGDSGPTIVPGKPEESLLIRSIRHEDADLHMPKKAPKLEDAVIADFVAWVKMGAADPRDAPDPPKPADAKSWPEKLVARRGWWSLQPVRAVALPPVREAAWTRNEVDRLLLAKMEERHLRPTRDADPAILFRRLAFALTGLPPDAQEVDAFVRACADPTGGEPQAFARAVDAFLAAPQFGEHWARHWMDLVRYAETHGSEGDYEIPEAWQYRDYLIRAFNSDVPCDQLIRESLAGDLLDPPRWNASTHVNESMIGLASLRFNEQGNQPIDTLEEQVRTIDNQIDVVSKAFQGLTISCARCHDHKFDAISQRDYYALFGVFASCRPAQRTLDAPEYLAGRDADLSALKGPIRDALAETWLTAAEGIPGRLEAGAPEDTALTKALADAKGDPGSPLQAWALLGHETEEFHAKWEELKRATEEGRAASELFNREKMQPGWSFPADAEAWFKHGSGLADQQQGAGAFALLPAGAEAVDGLEPAGIYTALLSRKHNGHFTSPRFKVATDKISVHAAGGGGAWVRVIFDNYPLNLNPTFPKAELKPGPPSWVTLDTSYRKGSWAYLELVTGNDMTRHEQSAPVDGRSWFGIDRVVFHNGEGPRTVPCPLGTLGPAEAPGSAAELASRYGQQLEAAIRSWQEGALPEAQRALLDYFLRSGLLPRSADASPKVAELLDQYRKVEADVPVPRRAPGVIEGNVYDAPLLPRGDHHHPGEAAPRRFLEVLGGNAYPAAHSGRLELANEIASPANPLTARVMVNRVWLYLFGQGLVATPDNFGRMGERPSHPELLDYLAARFVQEGWSFKRLIRYLLLSHAWQLSSDAPAEALEADPSNILLTHARVRRLEAEAIRDSLLALSGTLDRKLEGRSLEDPAAPRRSIYLAVQRTKLNPFLQAFDAPKPYTTLGRRDCTNVPAQSLTLLNDPFVISLSKAWAASLIQWNPDASPEMRIRLAFSQALARDPSNQEIKRSREYLGRLAQARGLDAESAVNHPAIWQDFAQSIFNLKEFIYVR